MALVTNRRTFLQSSAAAGVGFWVTGGLHAAESKSPNEKIQVGCVGVGGKGDSDVTNASKFGKIYALCDVDAATLEGMSKHWVLASSFTAHPLSENSLSVATRRFAPSARRPVVFP